MIKCGMSYYPDITQGKTPDEIRNAVIAFAKVLGEQLSTDLRDEVSVDVPPVMSTRAQFDDIVSGRGCLIALMRPVAYLFAHRRRQAIVPACVANRVIDGQVGTTYFAQIYARRDVGLTTLAELATKPAETMRIAYGSRFSTSNFLIPASLLKQTNIHPFLFFKAILFTGGHDKAAEAVYRGEAEIGCGHDGVIKALLKVHADAEKRLVRLGRENIHSDPVAVDTDRLPARLTLAGMQKALGAAAKTPSGKAALELFWGEVKDLTPTKHENYASIERALEGLSLGEKDML
jgi:ABC-type phosphate/phosphonate transport system substrate-binding protein